MNFNAIAPDVKLMQVRLPHHLRRHPDFKNARIQIDGDQIIFQLTNQENNLPELWVYVADKGSWANVKFLVDAANPQT